MEAALAAQLFIRLTLKLAGYIFVIRASDAILPIFDILGGRRSSWVEKWTPLLKIRDTWWENYNSIKVKHCSYMSLLKVKHILSINPH